MKKIFRILLSLLFTVLLISVVCSAVYAEEFTVEGKAPARWIRNADDFAAFSDEVASGRSFEGEVVVLGFDVTLGGNFRPIGDKDHPFAGTFEGLGCNVTFEMTDAPDCEMFGLFGTVGKSGTVRNLRVSGTIVGKDCVGGICAVNNGKIENCLAQADVFSEAEDAKCGFICAVNNGTITNCFTLFYESEGKAVGENKGEYFGSFMKDTPVNDSIVSLRNASSANDTYIDWFWNYNGFPMFTREHGEHSFVYVDGIEPSCEYSGSAGGMLCSVCGQVISGLYAVPAIGHHTPEHVDPVPSTCTECGYTEGEVCSVCGKVISGCEKTEPAHGRLIEVDEVPPTATMDGMTAGKICSVCSERVEGFEIIPATGIDEAADKSTEDEQKDDTEKDEDDSITIKQDYFIIGTAAFGVIIIAVALIIAARDQKKSGL